MATIHVDMLYTSDVLKEAKEIFEVLGMEIFARLSVCVCVCV